MLSKVILFLAVWAPLLAYADSEQQTSFSDSLKNKIRMVQHLALNPVLIKAVGRRGETAAHDGATVPISSADMDTATQSEPDHMLVMQRFIERNTAFTEVRLADSNGNEVGSYMGAKSELNAELLDTALAEGAGRVFVGHMAMDERTRAVSTYVSAPVTDRDENVGVLVVGIRLGGSSPRVIN